VGEGGYLDIEVNGVVDIKKVCMNVRIIAMEKVMDCMAQFQRERTYLWRNVVAAS